MRPASSSRPWRGFVDAYGVLMWCCLNGFCGQAMSHHVVLSMRGSEDAHGLIVLSVERSCGCVSSLHVVLCGWVLWPGTVSSHRALHEGFCGCVSPRHLGLSRCTASSSCAVSRCSVDAAGLFVSSVERFRGCVLCDNVVLSEWVLWPGNVSSYRAVYEGI